MPELPSGTVTFLFTDIEGSTARWEHRPEAMAAALARHDALLRAAILDHGGHVVKTTGDGFHAAFARAPDAVAAALDAQRRLQAESWGESGPLQVRMALHTGAAEERDGDYFGPPLNRAARLMSAGHGGQVLLSEVTTALVRDALPAGIRLLDLGRHRLKDLTEPERVSQVVAPDLASDFPPLASLDARPHNLPIHPTALLGREHELAEVRQLFADGARLVTLTGPGGTGKTRLGLQVGAELLDHFADGAFFVDLAPISDPGLVVSTLARTMGLQDAAGRPLFDVLVDSLRGRRLLLLLDNFEQILAAATVVADLFRACPGLSVLVTSRAALRIGAEREFPVSSLALPDAALPVTPERLSQYAAVALFIERAVAIKPDFSVTNANAPAVAEICTRLDGLPLAIELAAARVRLLSPEAMLPRLGHRLALLTGGRRDLPARQQTLRSTIAWSYELLEPEEQRLFRQLGVFVGGFTLEAVEAVCDFGDDLGIDVLNGLESLLWQSLVQQQNHAEGDLRYTMLETIRQYAGEKLRESGEGPILRERYARWFLSLAEESEPKIRSSPDQREWLARTEADHDNLRAALAWSQADGSRAEIGLRLSGALIWFWMDRNHITEGRTWLEQALLAAGDHATSARAKALHGLGCLARRQGDYGQAVAVLEEALTLSRGVNDEWVVALTLGGLGMTSRHQGAYDRSAGLFTEALGLFRKIGDGWGIAWTLGNLGHLARLRSDFVTAEALYQESLAMHRGRGDRDGIAWSLGNLGSVAMARGDVETAEGLYLERLAHYRGLGFLDGIAYALEPLAELARRRGEAAQSRALYQEILSQGRKVGDKGRMAISLEGLALVAVTQGELKYAAQLLGAVTAARGAIGLRQDSILPSLRSAYDDEVAAVRSELGEEAFAAAWAEGRAMTLEQSVAYALDEQPSA